VNQWQKGKRGEKKGENGKPAERCSEYHPSLKQENDGNTRNCACQSSSEGRRGKAQIDELAGGPKSGGLDPVKKQGNEKIGHERKQERVVAVRKKNDEKPWWAGTIQANKLEKEFRGGQGMKRRVKSLLKKKEFGPGTAILRKIKKTAGVKQRSIQGGEKQLGRGSEGVGKRCRSEVILG